MVALGKNRRAFYNARSKTNGTVTAYTSAVIGTSEEIWKTAWEKRSSWRWLVIFREEKIGRRLTCPYMRDIPSYYALKTAHKLNSTQRVSFYYNSPSLEIIIIIIAWIRVIVALFSWKFSVVHKLKKFLQVYSGCWSRIATIYTRRKWVFISYFPT